MSAIITAEEWSEGLFSGCELGDKRRTLRLVHIACMLAKKIGKSLANVCDGNSAAIEGAYRFIRNPGFGGQDIAEGGFRSIAEKAKEHELLLALEDTTTFSYTHEAEGLEEIEAGSGNIRGFYVHSVLLVDAQKERTIGLIDQQRWQRKASEAGKRHQRKNREYEEKESYKWEMSSRLMESRLGEKIKDVISVCDREADIYDYLQFKQQESQRFIVRAVQDRKLESEGMQLSDMLNESPIMGYSTVKIAQKSGRKAREAKLELRSCKVTLKGIRRKGVTLPDLEINVVSAVEVGKLSSTSKRLSWVILTSEPINSLAEVQTIIRYYEMRWRIEEFHKAWKTGAGSERQRMQAADNLEKMIVILGFVATRLLQLREALEVSKSALSGSTQIACTEVLTKEEYIMLWYATQENKTKKQSLPKKPPDLIWAYAAIARLGGWTNSKQTNKASWLTIWEGWYRVQERVLGYQMAKEMTKI